MRLHMGNTVSVLVFRFLLMNHLGETDKILAKFKRFNTVFFFFLKMKKIYQLYCFYSKIVQ